MNEDKKLWFKRKTYGWGWTPTTWQGWVVIAIYVLLITPIFFYSDNNSHSASDTLLGAVLPFIVLTSGLIFICYKKGESPKWQWGNSKLNNDHPWVGVDAFILNDKGEILLEKRAQSMSAYPGSWCLPGGWMEWGEKVEDAVKREVHEEIGVEVDVVKFIGKYFDTNNLPIKKNSRIALPHICKIVSGEPKVNQIEEVEEIKWINPKEALNLEIAYDQKDMIRYVVDNGLI